MLKKIQVPLNGTSMDIFIDQKNHQNALSYLKNNNIKPKEFIYLNVGGSLPHKQWPIEQFIALAKIILQNTSLSIVFGGGPDDIQRINSINNQIKQERIVFTRQRTLGENCALINKAKIIITPDSGPMHIGLALKVPTISLWPTIGLIKSTGAHGAIDPMNGPDYCGPLNIDNTLSCVLLGNFFNKSNIVTTSIYRNFNNTEVKVEPYHLEAISVDDVWEKILKFL
jgi:ADP-heptose:LPS heptosyltransferase